VDKGLNPDVEMYSAFWDPFRVSVSELGEKLKEVRVTDVFVVGLAVDYCVKATATSAVEEGYRTYIVEEGTRPVQKEAWEAEGKKEVEKKGIKLVSASGDEIQRVKNLGAA
jgi:nicotinamidase-related amidase